MKINCLQLKADKQFDLEIYDILMHLTHKHGPSTFKTSCILVYNVILDTIGLNLLSEFEKCCHIITP